MCTKKAFERSASVQTGLLIPVLANIQSVKILHLKILQVQNMASSLSGYRAVSTIPDVIVDMKGPDKGGYKDISDLTGTLYAFQFIKGKYIFHQGMKTQLKS